MKTDPQVITTQFLPLMMEAAVQSSKVISNKLACADLSIWKKQDETLVTEADLESQKCILSVLGDSLPIVAEENPVSHCLLESEDNYLLIDPLDGTTSAKRFRGQAGGQVGYGPIIGLVCNQRLIAACYVNIPQGRGLIAVLGQGCRRFLLEDPRKVEDYLPKQDSRSIQESALLFFAGKAGELEAVSKIRQAGGLENYYRFGGFANDSMRVALGFEQGQLQFSVKACDLPAVLFPHEVGCKVVINPLGDMKDIADHRPALENPVILGQKVLVEKLLSVLRS